MTFNGNPFGYIRESALRSDHVKAFGYCGKVKDALVVFGAKDGATLHVEYVNLCGLGSRHEQRTACELHRNAAWQEVLLDGFDRILSCRIFCRGVFLSRILPTRQ